MARDGETKSAVRHGAQGGRRREAAGAATGAEKGVIERILDSAEAVLRRHGYAGFTTRRVAEEAGIAPGNLSYHYPAKRELLVALITRLVARYSERLQSVLQKPGFTPGRGLEATVRWLLEESVAEETMWLFRELWAMALHDEVVRGAVDDFYDELMDRVAGTLQRDCPAADPQDVRDLVQLIALISEGGAVLYGTRRNRVTPYPRMIDLTVRLIGVISPELSPSRD